MLKLYAKFVLWRNHYCLKHMEEKYYVMWDKYSCRACRDERWKREDSEEKERVKRHNEKIAKALSKLNQEKI